MLSQFFNQFQYVSMLLKIMASDMKFVVKYIFSVRCLCETIIILEQLRNCDGT